MTQTMQIIAIYRQSRGPQTYSAVFQVPAFDTNGKDCDTPEVLAQLMTGLRAEIIAQAETFHRAGGVPMPSNRSRFLEGINVLAFYTDRRAKALVERFDAPVSMLNGEG